MTLLDNNSNVIVDIFLHILFEADTSTADNIRWSYKRKRETDKKADMTSILGQCLLELRPRSP